MTGLIAIWIVGVLVLIGALAHMIRKDTGGKS